jgi:predicted RNase H-like nuclease
VASQGSGVTAFVVPSIRAALDRIGQPAVLAIDIPIGLRDEGPRDCDLAARRLLGRPRGSSVFPAPVRAALDGTDYAKASELHYQADGRRLTLQAFGILPKIREVDDLLTQNPSLQNIVHEVHPELSFAIWNRGVPMTEHKIRVAGRVERESLIAAHWQDGLRVALVTQLKGSRYKPDDLNDALAALWTAERIYNGTAQKFPSVPSHDSRGLKMEISA